MDICNFCGNPIEVPAQRYSAAQVRTATRGAGLSDKATIGDFAKAFGMTQEKLITEWLKRTSQPELDWVLCRMCGLKVEQYLAKAPAPKKSWQFWK